MFLTWTWASCYRLNDFFGCQNEAWEDAFAHPPLFLSLCSCSNLWFFILCGAQLQHLFINICNQVQKWLVCQLAKILWTIPHLVSYNYWVSPGYASHVSNASHILHALEPWRSCTTLVRKWHRWPENPLVKIPTAPTKPIYLLLVIIQKIYSGKYEGRHGLRPHFSNCWVVFSVGVSLDLATSTLSLPSTSSHP